MDLSVYIKELLYKYNCVIVPGFGAFVLNYESASVNNISGSFYPPHKSILFNPSVNRNDGLMTDYISFRMNITFEEAAIILTDAIEELKLNLFSGKKIVFKDIGSFTFNSEGSIVFEPLKNLNLYLEGYGLSVFNSPAIDRMTVSGQANRKLNPRNFETKERRMILAAAWSAAASVALIAFIAWSVFNSDIFKNINTNYTSILNSLVQRIYISDLPKQMNHAQKPPAIKTDTTLSAYNIPSPRQTLQVVGKPESDLITEDAPDVNSRVIDKYIVIGGCFSIEDNAYKLIDQLKQNGYQPFIFDKTSSGLTRVAYASFNNYQDAAAFIAKIRSSENPNVWLLHK